jgi:2-hydroxy-4-(methylsulfanyl)butanoate S-methyltransferase
MMNKVLHTADDINRIAFGYMASKALFSALEFNIFSILAENPMTLGEIIQESGIAQNRAEIFLTALVSVGLLDRKSDKFFNSPASDRYLIPGRKSFFGDYLRMQIARQMYPSMQRLDAVLTSEEDASHLCSYADWMSDPEQADLFSRSQHIGSQGPAAVFAQRVDLKGCKSLLDVGGGTGAFSITLCRQYPELQITILDFPNVAEIGAEFVAREGLSDRISFLDADVLDSVWPGNQEVVLMSYFLSAVPAKKIGEIFEMAKQALKQGGLLLLHDFMVNDDFAGPTLSALWALQHLLFSPDTMSLTPGRLNHMLDEAGFSVLGGDTLIPEMTRYTIAKKRD